MEVVVMWKKKLVSLFLLLLMAGGVYAESAPRDSTFSCAKNALLLLSQGDEQGALDLISFQFTSDKYSSDGFIACVRKYLPDIVNTSVQTEVAVCYWESIGSHWLIAVPVNEPSDGDVLCLVLMSSDKSTFDGYAVLTWSEVTEGTDHAEWVWWNS